MPVPRPIVYVVEYYPPFGAGGAERTAALHAELLARSGQPVLVVTPNYGAAPQERVRGVDVFRFPFQRLPAQEGRQVHQARFLTPAYHRHAAREILRCIGGRRVRCLHAQNANSMIGAALASARLSVPLVTHIRDTASICGLGALCLMEPGRAAPPPRCGAGRHIACHVTRYVPAYQAGASLKRRLAGAGYMAAVYGDFLWRKRVHRQAARIVFASESLRKLYGTLRDFQDAGKHRVVYAPVIPEDGHETASVADALPEAVRQLKGAGYPLVLYVGKVSKGKGGDVLFAAHRRLLGRMPEARLVVAGNMDSQPWDYDRQRTVTLGFVERARLGALYRACDVVALPSTWPEPLGWATLDAGRHAKPIVATRVGGIAEAVTHGVTGLLVEKLDEHGMSDALYTLLTDRALAQRMGAAARVHVQGTFGEAAVRQQLEHVYEGLGDDAA